MEFFKQNTSIDFMGARIWTAVLSILLFVGAFVALLTHGLSWGLDFTGGTQIEVSFKESADLESIRNKLDEIGQGQAVVQSYGTSRDVLISLPAQKEDVSPAQAIKSVMSALPNAEKKREEFIGPQVGKELTTKGILAILVSLLGTMIYIALRFEYRFAVCSALALIHDPLLILGVFAWYGIEFDLKSLAAILAVIGYSLNDTIVVFDRVRENFRKVRKASPVEIMNLSINQTLSRTIMTSALTLIVVVALLVYGGETLRGFSLALALGILVGTYSSIYVAGALALAMGLERGDLLPKAKVVDDRP